MLGLGGMFSLTRPAHADAPKEVELLRSADANIVIQLVNATLTPTPIVGSETVRYKGSGTLRVHIGGVNFPDIPSCPIDYVGLDASGNLAGAMVKAPSKLSYKDVLHTGMDLEFPKDAQISLIKDPGSNSKPTLKVTEGSVLLPYKNPDGNQVRLDFTSQDTVPGVLIKASGEMSFHAKAGKVTLKPAGFRVTGETAEVTFLHLPGAGNDTTDIKIGMVKVDTPIPGVFASRRAPQAPTATDSSDDSKKDDPDRPPLHLAVNELHLDADGQVSFSNGTLDTAEGTAIDLPQLGGFWLDVTAASVTFEKNKPKAPSSVTVNVHLPDNFTADAEGKMPCEINDVTLLLDHGADVTITKPFEAHWNRFGVKTTDSFEIDLRKTGGLTINSAKLLLPDDFVDASANSTPEIEIEKAKISSQGFSGTVNIAATQPDPSDKDEADNETPVKVKPAVLKTIHLDNFDTDIKRLSIRFFQSDLKECRVNATIKISDLDNKAIPIDVGVTSAGNVSVSATPGTDITVDSLHVKTHLDSGTFHLDENNNWQMALTGSIAPDDSPDVPDWLQDTNLRFKDLNINSDGHIGPGEVWVTMPDAAQVKLGPVRLQLSELGFGQNAPDATEFPNRYWMGLSAFVDIEGLPLQLASSFKGVRIYKPVLGSNKPDFKLGEIEVDASYAGVFKLHALLSDNSTLHRSNGTNLTITPPVLYGKPMHLLLGHADVALLALGSGGAAPSLSMDFMVGESSWFVMGGIGLPAPIPLGQSGLALFGFAGGAGYNVTGGEGVPMRDYIPVPDVDAIANHKTSLLFVAATRIGQAAPVPPPLWGDVILTVHLPSIQVDLSGGLSVLNVTTPLPAEMPADFTALDRTLTGYIYVDASKPKFHANLTADLNFPTRKKVILSATGALDLNIESGNSYFNFGNGITAGGLEDGDFASTAANRKAALDALNIANPVQIKLTLPDFKNHNVNVKVSPIQGALTADFTHDKLKAAFIFDAFADIKGKLSEFDVDITWDAGVSMDLRGLMVLDWKNGFDGYGAARVKATGWVNASADLYVYSPSTKLYATLEGDLGVVVHSNPSPSLVVDGDLDVQLKWSVAGNDFDFHINPHLHEEVHL